MTTPISQTPETDKVKFMPSQMHPAWNMAQWCVKAIEMEKLELRLREAESKAAHYRGWLYGCDKHKLWNGTACIGCIEDERDAQKQRADEWEKVATGLYDSIRIAAELLNDEGDVALSESLIKSGHLEQFTNLKQKEPA